jgi:3-oxoacyl-[acyl-carrier protein] reductase
MPARVDFDFAGRRVVLTGGGGLIARECAALLVAAGAHVHLVDPRSQALEAAVASLAAGPGTVTAARSDLATPAACREALSGAGAAVTDLAHLAGIFDEDPFLPDGSPVWETALEANLSSAYRVAALFPEIRDCAEVSRMVFVSSMAAERGAPLHVAYATAKAGLHGLVRSLARRLGPQVIVNGVSPGIIESPMAAALLERIGDKGYREGCLRRYGRAEEIARVVVFLLSEGASYLTGQMIRVDGGASMK